MGLWVGSVEYVFYFADDLQASFAAHFGVHADGNHVFIRWKSLEINGCGVFSKCFVVRQIVCRRQIPMFVAVDETEIAGVVIVVVGVMVENHPSELLFHSRRRLREVACELQERVVIHFGW